MKIREIRLNKFKRFTETTITAIPEETKLVVLAGANGSGKSSLIEAANYYGRQVIGGLGGFEETYHLKQIPGVAPRWNELVSIDFYGPQLPEDQQTRRKAIYARSAYRNEPEFQLDGVSQVGSALVEGRLGRLIDNDATVSRNYKRLVSLGVRDLYGNENDNGDVTFARYREESIGLLKQAVARLFPGLSLSGLGNPLAGGTFLFSKGDSTSFAYKNLSGGEKAAFDLLLDLVVKLGEYNDTVYFIDEPEAHMAAGLQAALLEELFALIPGNGQLWIASHSIAMMRKARDLALDHPGSVAFLDFDGVNFDLPNTRIVPTAPDRPFWTRAMQIAMDDIAGYVLPEHVVLCEGGGVGEGKTFDSDCFNDIFKIEHPHVIFLGAGSANDVESDPKGVSRLLMALAPAVVVTRLIDRDDRTDEEVAELNRRDVKVLSLRNIESYLLDDEIITAFCTSLGREELANDLLNAKRSALRASIEAGGPADDFKRVAGDVYNAAKRLFPERKLGNDQRAFMKGFCAALIRPGTQIYARLAQDIFG